MYLEYWVERGVDVFWAVLHDHGVTVLDGAEHFLHPVRLECALGTRGALTRQIGHRAIGQDKNVREVWRVFIRGLVLSGSYL